MLILKAIVLMHVCTQLVTKVKEYLVRQSETSSDDFRGGGGCRAVSTEHAAFVLDS